VTVILSNFAR